MLPPLFYVFGVEMERNEMMMAKSKITGKEYDPNKVLYINYPPQIEAYMSNGGYEELIDVFYDRRKKVKYKMVYVFPRNEKMKQLYEKWKNRELEF